MNQENEFGAFAKEVALMLDISTSNLRKWSILLENKGYEFERNDKNQRIYYERDINVLSQLKIVIEKNRNVEDAVNAVIKGVKEKKNVERTLSVIQKDSDKITLSKNDLNDLISRSVEVAVQKQRSEFMKVFPGILEQAVSSAVQEERKALPSPEDFKSIIKETMKEQYGEMFEEYRKKKNLEESVWKTRHKVATILRKEAIEIWDKKPESERFIKAGFFKKEEDVIKKENFIADYIDTHIVEKYEEEIKKA